jgi:acyl-CoA dehydrogenase
MNSVQPLSYFEPERQSAPEDVYLHDTEELEFFLWEVLQAEQRFLGKPPFEALTRQRADELIRAAKRHAQRLAQSYSDADGDHARLLENGDVAIPQAYHELWQEHLRDWFWIRQQGDSVLIQANQRERLPHVLMQLMIEMLVGANPSFMTYAGFTPSAVNLLRARATQEQQQIFLDKLTRVEWDACLCTTEPQAGSDLSAIATSATRIEADVFSVSGEKKYITAGMHPLTCNTVYLVLGRIAGRKPSSLSMSAFLVPRYWPQEDGSLTPNNVECIKVESKMGLKGCANTHLRFGATGVTRGYLLGNRANVGLLQLQMLMRKARIGTGNLALGMASSAYLRSLRYARQRVQGSTFDQSANPGAARVAIIEHVDVQRMLLEMKAKVEGCRSILARIANSATRLQQLTPALLASGEDAEVRRLRGLALFYSPIAKAYVSDEAWNIVTQAIQVHGAVGYMADIPLEQYARDIKILTIWEGTNYIQAQDLVRDKLGFGRHSSILQDFEADLRAFLMKQDDHPDLAPEFQRLTAALQATLAGMRWVTQQADNHELLQVSQVCTRILQMFGDLIAAWGLLEAASVAGRKLREPTTPEFRKPFYRGKIKTMRFFVYNLLPRLFHNHAVIMDAANAYVRLEDAEFGYAEGRPV